MIWWKSKQGLSNKQMIIAKAIFAGIIPILTFFSLELLDYQLNMFAIGLFGAGLLFTIPFYLTLAKIKKSPPEPVAKYIIIDFITITFVAVLSSLACDLVNIIRFGMQDFSGITTLLLSLIFLLINIVFAIMYTITMKKKSPKKEEPKTKKSIK